MAEKKNWVEIFLLPLVIAGVGTFGTYFITQQQEANAQVNAASDRQIAKDNADSDRQIKILEIFSDKITHRDENQRLLALELLRVLDDDLAGKLASAVAKAEKEGSSVRKVATKLADVTKARIELRPRIYMHVRSNAERMAAKAVERLLEKNNWIVPGIERVGVKAPKVSLLKYFKKADETMAKQILSSLTKANYNISLKYISGYEDSKAIRPMHFEIWFASGKPRAFP